MSRTLLLLTICLAACGRQEFGAPCEVDDDCERKLECRAESAPQSADGQTCSQACGEETDYCSAAECWGGSCVRECEVTAPDCPDGTICAVLTSISPPRGYCVLPCMTADDCGGVFMYCPQPGGPCTSDEEEVPPWSS